MFILAVVLFSSCYWLALHCRIRHGKDDLFKTQVTGIEVALNGLYQQMSTKTVTLIRELTWGFRVFSRIELRV